MSLLYKFRWLTSFSMLLFDYLMYITGPGGFIFWIAETFYTLSFNILLRQKADATGRSAKSSTPSCSWSDARVVGRNRRPPHVPMSAFSKISEALSYFKRGVGNILQTPSENIYYLTGPPGDAGCKSSNWQFQLIGNPDSAPDNWQSRLYDDLKWDEMNLPAHWQLSGYDIPIYTNTSYPFRFDPPYAVRDGQWRSADCDVFIGGTNSNGGKLAVQEPGSNATGLYRKHFFLPSSWDVKSDRIFIVFEGVDSCIEVWLNGDFIGYSQDSCLPAEFDVTDSLVKLSSSAQHVLAVRVMRWCDGSYLEDQDKWWLSGIYREVFLMRKPSRLIFDYEVSSDLTFSRDDECIAATINIDVLVEGDIHPTQDNWSASGGAIRMELWSPGKATEPLVMLVKEVVSAPALPGSASANKLVNAYESDIDMTPLRNPAVASFRFALKKPQLWTAETPVLYYCTISLHKNFNDAKLRRDTASDVECCPIGIREVKTHGLDNSLCANRIPILIKGVNRHEFDNFTGRAVSKKTMCHDMTLMKKSFFNAVRNAHYPPHPYWHELCNSAGMYVVDEANIETHGFQTLGQPVGYLSSLPEWKGAFLNRVARMYERDKNNPCIIIWSLGNECGVGDAHFDMYKWLKARDPRRLVQYESGGSLTDVTDIICPMYRRPDWCVEQARFDLKQRPVVLCEYAHMMGNSGGCMARYWNSFTDPMLPRMQGGFIWDFVDQGLNLAEGGFGYGGDFGDLPNTKQFCCNGLFGPDRMPHPSAFETAALQAPLVLDIELDKTTQELWVTIKNLRQFRDLGDIRIEICLRCDAQPVGAFSASVTFECGCIRPFTIGRRRLSEIFPAMGNGASCLQSATGLSMETIETVREVWVEMAAVILPGDDWIPKGHDVVRKSFMPPLVTTALLSNLNRPPLSSKRNSTISFVRSEHEVVVSWTGNTIGQAVISTQCGRLITWEVRNAYGYTESLITEPVDVCVWRACTDNDRGGAGFSYFAIWTAAGLHDMQRSGDVSVIVEDKTSSVDDKVPPTQRILLSIKSSWKLVSPKGSAAEHHIHCSAQYDFMADGSIAISQKTRPSNAMPPLPRIGARCAVPSSFAHVEWLGQGPHEAYDDRKSAVRLGRFSSQVESLHTPYVFPQECGHRIEPRWIALREGATGVGMMLLPAVMQMDSNQRIVGVDASGWGWNASRYSTEMLHNATHDHELTPDPNKIYVHLDRKMMGIGGYDSWTPNVDSEYLIKPVGSFDTTFILLPILEQDDLHDVYYSHNSCKVPDS